VTVIAILAIGMTMVVITAGIDLSVGSLVALSAMVSTLLIRELAGAREATWLGMIPCCLAGIAVCAGLGAFNGVMVAFCRLPPFIVTLSMMLIASGFAFLLTRGESVAEVPASFVWLGGGADLWHIPNAVVLMLLLYGGAHVLMAHTVLGRYLYAVGGNVEAARLSGVPVSRVKLFAYTASGLFAGLGGVVLASRLKSAAPPYGQMYELYVIAAVVVGGTSLMGGEGRIFGTCWGCF
jgi:ribose transport system permease protein